MTQIEGELLESGRGSEHQDTARLDIDGEGVGHAAGAEGEAACAGFQNLFADVEGEVALEDVPSLVLAMMHVERGLGRLECHRLGRGEALLGVMAAQLDGEAAT
jgi:hypothetical protein